MRSLRVGLLSGLCLLAGCDHRQSLGGGFELRQAQNWNPDGHPGIRLYHQGREVWPAVGWGEGGPEKNVHGDVCVFEVLLSPDDNAVLIDGGLEEVPSTNALASESPAAYGSQLFAVRGAGLPVLISPGILSGKGEGASGYGTYERYGRYEVVRAAASDSGVIVVFRCWLKEDEERALERTNSVSWENISRWLVEAEKRGELHKSPEGDYRVLKP